MASGHSWVHPCQRCGACCAHFRVGFYWREAETGADAASENPVPLELTEDVDSRLRCMKGTNQKHHAKCVALKGRVGESVACSIYANRPTPCRNFEASYESGKHRPRCDEARAKHGLKPLRREDWKTPSNSENAHHAGEEMPQIETKSPITNNEL